MRPIGKPFPRARFLALTAVALGLAPAGAQAQTPMSFYPLTPCRVWDTRPSSQHLANTTRNFPVRGVCGVPATAQAVALNLTVTFGALPNRDLGNMRAFPAGTPVPPASVLNWLASDSAIANGQIIPLGDDGSGNHISIRIDMPVGSTGAIFSLSDVTGYFQ